mgnify:FL=1|tara:strand:- start:679 stop:1308 length:630 start_codon:yes stop_codon:yes gene_type:complete
MKDQYITLFSPPPLGMTHWDGDLKYLEDEIKKYEFQRNSENSITVSNRLLDDPPFIDLKNFIHDFVYRYTLKVFRTRQKIEMKQSWVNITDSGESHPKHMHPNSYLSGVMFVKADQDAPPLMFENQFRPYQLYVDLYDGGDQSLPPNEFSNCDIANEAIAPVPGRIVLFTSPSPHLVPKSMSKSERITLSFNTWPARPFGSEHDVTYVY